MSLHARIAKALGWTEAEVKSFSFQALREIVRPVDPKLADELSEELRSGRYIIGERRG